jgi:hypothetical protein
MPEPGTPEPPLSILHSQVIRKYHDANLQVHTWCPEPGAAEPGMAVLKGSPTGTGSSESLLRMQQRMTSSTWIGFQVTGGIWIFYVGLCCVSSWSFFKLWPVRFKFIFLVEFSLLLVWALKCTVWVYR